MAFTSQSFGPNGGFPTPFVPEIVFFCDFPEPIVLCYNVNRPHCTVVQQQQALVWHPHTHTPSVGTTHSLCGNHTQPSVRAGGGRFAESLEALCSTHTHPRSLSRAAVDDGKLRCSAHRSAAGAQGPKPPKHTLSKLFVGFFDIFGPLGTP